METFSAHRKRLRDSLAHKQPDKIPIDLGSTAVTGIHVLAIDRLRDFYGLDKRPVKLLDPYQMLGEIEDDLAEILHLDTIGLFPSENLFGFPNDCWKEFRTHSLAFLRREPVDRPPFHPIIMRWGRTI